MQTQRPLRVLITNINLGHRTGTVIVARDVALNLRRRGHHPVVYSPKLGEVAEELKAQAIDVVDDLGDCPTPDVIHGHHNITTMLALAAFPASPAIWFSRGWKDWFDLPPRSFRIHRYIAVDETRRDYLVTRHGIASPLVTVLHNAVDLRRIPPRGPLPPRPRSVMVFTKGRGYAKIIEIACARMGLRFGAIGVGVELPVTDPERYLVNYDVVFATGRMALEALCCGASVIVGDGRGLAGIVTSGNLQTLRDLNFGSVALTRKLTVPEVEAEIRRYDRADASAIVARIRDEADLERLLDRVEQLYRDAIAANPDGGWTAQHSREFKDFLDTWPVPTGMAERWERERQTLADLIARNDADL